MALLESPADFLPKRGRKIRRRFSSASPTQNVFNGPLPMAADISRRQHRQISLTLGRFSTERSRRFEDVDAEEEESVPVRSLRSTPSLRHLYDHDHEHDEEDDELKSPLMYSSLPPTPVSSRKTTTPFGPESPSDPSSVPSPLTLSRQRSLPITSSASFQSDHNPDVVPFSLWDYLREELLATDFDSHQELKWERVGNFLSIPLAMEKIITFGFIVCFDSFLYTFTILPIRFFLALSRLVANIFRLSPPPLPPSQKADILRALLLLVSVLILNPLADASKIYHTIRGQDTIKLYVIFNALEIGDRLCASIGQDIIDCLLSRSTLEPLSHRRPLTSHTFRPVLYFVLATLYTVAHALVMVYQLIALNVAINSYDHSLLTLLVSNQFVEIKGSVFKKFEKDTLFQITCADIVERFSLALMLCIVAFRNLIELSGTEFDFASGFVLPKSFGRRWWLSGNVFLTISYPVLTVLLSEMLVDWLKHAFITKFNHIRPSVYDRYIDILCRDLVASGSAVGRKASARKHVYVDQSPLVARRLGFAAIPLAAISILIGSQSVALILADAHSEDFVFSRGSCLGSSSGNVLKSPDRGVGGQWPAAQTKNRGEKWISHGDVLVRYVTWAGIAILVWLCFLVVKVIVGVNLLSFAARRREGTEYRAGADDAINDFGRDPIGEGKEEQAYNKKLRTLLHNVQDDAPRIPEMGESQSQIKGVNVEALKLDGGKPLKQTVGRGLQRVKLEDLTRYTMVKKIW